MLPNELKAKFGISAGWRYPSSGRLHASWDIPTTPGDAYIEVHSPVDGVVTDCRDGIPNGGGNYPNGPSNWITVTFQHPTRGTISYYFQHLGPGLGVKRGQRISKGTFLGRVGLTGNTSGWHLHLTLQEGRITESSRYNYLATQGRTAIFPPDYETPDKEPEPEPIQEDDDMLVVMQGSRRMLLHGPHTTRVSKSSADSMREAGVPVASVTKEDFDSLGRADNVTTVDIKDE